MTDPEVLIVGAGPVGLAARALLARWGVRTVLVEKRGELSPFPRSRLVNVRSMEIFRQLGLAETVKARAFAPEFGRIRFRDTLGDHDFGSAGMVGINAPIAESPVIGALTSQDRLEPTLFAATDSEVRYGVELVDIAEEGDRVVASLVDHNSGARTRIRARYVLAADGANSVARQRLGIGTAGPGAVARLTTVVFEADLHSLLADQPAGVYATAHGSFLPIYPEGGWAWIDGTPEDPARTEWADLVGNALGPKFDVRVDVLRVQHWVVNAFASEHFGRGRVLLAGDAAHAIPPSGGLGMNVGLADVHNLCWKLAGVLQGWAGPGLLATFEPERQPVALRNLRQAVANAQLAHEVQNRRREQLVNGAAASAEVELPWSEEYFAQLGLVLGVAYDSAAVLADDTVPEPPEPGTDYVPTPVPGHRMPHAWLADGRSTLDAVGEWFTLLTAAPAEWAPQVQRAQEAPRARQAAGPWPLRVEALPAEHIELFGLGPRGALLVRPDGHIAARWPDGPPLGSALCQALAAVTSSAG